MINQAIHRIASGNDLSSEATRAVMHEMMTGRASPAQMGAFLIAMRMKGETINEITACAEILRERCVRLAPGTDVMDIVGTGGDQSCSFNISTVSAFVIAAAGVPVAKHGGRSVSSRCGSADMLEAIGAIIDLTAEQNSRVLEKTGMCFMLSSVYHSAMKHVAPVRRELGVRTIFNILGPLANPAGATMQLLGVYDENLVEPMARVLLNLGVKRAMVVHGHDGLDEVTLTGPTTICEIHDGQVSTYSITPEQFGLNRCDLNVLIGGDPSQNAAIAKRILDGEPGPTRDIVVLNSACCLYLGKPGLTMKECARLAESTIDSGAAKAKLEHFVEATQEVS